MTRPHTFKVTEGVFCVMRKSYFTNSYFVQTTSGLVAVDAGMKTHGGDMLAALIELGRSPSDVQAILVTHWHNDHAAGAAELAEVTNAPVYYHRTDLSTLPASRHSRACVERSQALCLKPARWCWSRVY